MTLTQLECFITVAHERHFRRAADRLERTQPAVSVQIQKLEGTLGLRLFERAGARVCLTAAGEAFLPDAEKILAESRSALLKMEEIRGGVSGRIRIAVVPTVAAHFLPTVLRRFELQFPNVELTLHEEKLSQGVIALLLKGDIDVAFAVDGSKAPGIRTWNLLREEYYLCVARTHPLASATEVTAGMLKNERFVTYKNQRHQSREAIYEICRAEGFEPKIGFESEESETIQFFVAENLGVTVFPEMVMRHARRKGLCALKIAPDPPKRTIVIHRKVGSYASKALMHFIALANELGQEWEAED